MADRGFTAELVRKLFSVVAKNWPIKLTALVLAVVLWAVMAAEETTTQLVPVTLVVQPPEGRAMIGELPTVQARFRGTLRELLKLYESPPLIRKEVPATAGASRGIQLSLGDLQRLDDAEVDALEVIPDSITVVLDDILRKPVPVVSRVDIRADSGYEVSGPVRISPSTVMIEGPEAIVAPIESVATVPIQRSELTDDAEYTVQIDTSGFGLVSVEPQSVRVTAEIGPVATQVLMGVVVQVEGPGGPWQSGISAVSVTVRGPASRVRQFTRDSVRVVARSSGAREEEVVALDVISPSGVTGTATPDSVVIRRRDGG